jgi:hypothetical protein
MKSGFRNFLTPPEIPAPTENNHPARKQDVPVASDATPEALGVAAAGVGTAFSRADHVHPSPTPQDLSGLLKKDGTEALTADWDAGAFAIRSLLKIVNKTANATLTDAECRGAVVTNAGAADTLEFTLPAAVIGASVTIYAKEAEIIEAIPAAGERFSSASADEQLDSAGDLGNSLTLVCMQIGVWEVVSSSGTWEVPA